MNKSKRFFNIRDIAQLAGVSTATVSRVMNSPNSTSERSREKVLKVIDEYGYIPNKTAANLFSGTSNTIALFVLDISNPFYISLMKHLNRIAFENNYNLIICETEDSIEKEKNYYDYCKSIRTCGIIYTAGSTRRHFKLDAKNSIPLVLTDRRDFEDKPCFCVKSNNDHALQLLVDYLYNLNHRKIGFIGGPLSVLSVKERYESFLSHMEAHCLKVPDAYVQFGTFEEKTGVELFDYFYSLPDAPTAIIAASDQLARGFIMRANALGVSIPNEFSVCGIDAVDTSFYPKLTSIRQNTELLAQTAFDFLKNWEESPEPRTTVIDVSFSIGNTCKKLE